MTYTARSSYLDAERALAFIGFSFGHASSYYKGGIAEVSRTDGFSGRAPRPAPRPCLDPCRRARAQTGCHLRNGAVSFSHRGALRRQRACSAAAKPAALAAQPASLTATKSTAAAPSRPPSRPPSKPTTAPTAITPSQVCAEFEVHLVPLSGSVHFGLRTGFCACLILICGPTRLISRVSIAHVTLFL